MSTETLGFGQLITRLDKLQGRRLKIDKEIKKTQSLVIRQSKKRLSKEGRRGPVPGSKKPKQRSLDEFIQDVMIPGKPMTPAKVTELVREAGYKTMGKGNFLAATVGLRMREHSHIKHVKRGIYVYNPRAKKRNRSASGQFAKAS
tara:strand:+ start:6983 stop:7417 length:435 start_codon:yes stop_codon:yes gene_type:complete